jgi:hypothetical protein
MLQSNLAPNHALPCDKALRCRAMLPVLHVPAPAACTSSYSRMNISAAMPLGISGIKRTANLSAEGLYR